MAWLVAVTGKPEKATRSLLGRWISLHGNAAVLDVLESASRNPPPSADYVPWLEKALRMRAERLGTGGSGRKLEPGAAAFLEMTDPYFRGVN